jgi:hypothetical protein
MNTSPPEHWQVSSPYACLPKGFQGVLIAHAAWRTQVKLYPMIKHRNILWCSVQCSVFSVQFHVQCPQVSEIQVYESFHQWWYAIKNSLQLYGVYPTRPNAVFNDRYWILFSPSMFVLAIFVKQTEAYFRTDPMSPLYSSITQNGSQRKTSHRFQQVYSLEAYSPYIFRMAAPSQPSIEKYTQICASSLN